MKAVRVIHLIGLFPIASGIWNSAANAGLFYRNWNNNRSNDNNGFYQKHLGYYHNYQRG